MAPFGGMESESGGLLKGAGVHAMMDRGWRRDSGGQGLVKKKKKGGDVGVQEGMHPPSCSPQMSKTAGHYR